MRIRFKSNLTGGLFASGFSAALWFLIPGQISLMNNNHYIDARFVPRIMAAAIGIGGIILIIQSLCGRDKVIEIDLKKEARALLYIALLVLYASLLPIAGYLITTTVLGLLTLLMSRVRNKSYYLITLVLVLLLYGIFTFLLKINLP